MQQRYFDGSVKPVAPHRLDVVECSDGTRCNREDALLALDGTYHTTDEDRLEADTYFIHGVVDDYAKLGEEYTEYDDYGAEYTYVALEGMDDDAVRDGVRDYINNFAEVSPEECERIVAHIMDYEMIEAEHYSNEYSAWHGDGVEIGSFEVGEIEHQADLTQHNWYADYDKDELETILDAYKGDAYLSQWRGKYVHHNCLTLALSPGGRWHYFIPGSFIRDAVNDYLERCDAE